MRNFLLGLSLAANVILLLALAEREALPGPSPKARTNRKPRGGRRRHAGG